MTLLHREIVKQGEKLAHYFDMLSGIGILLLDRKLNIKDCSQGFMEMFNLQQIPLGSPVTDFLILRENDLSQTEALKISCSHQSNINGIINCSAAETDNGYLLFCERLILTEGRAIEQIGVINNELINLQRESEKKNLLLKKLGRELDGRIAELEATLSRVKQLEGIIPICMYCKKIRDDHESWQGLEKYISEHSEAKFSHGLCPACFEKQMEEMET